jgi:hypothetical protein
MKKVIFGLLMLSSLLVVGCNFGKPAYSDVQVDNKTKGETSRAEPTATQNPEPAASSSEDPIAKAEREAGIASSPQQQNPPQEKKEVQIPSFFVSGSAEIKDLPKYKNSAILNVQYGPVNGVNSAMLIFESRDSVEKINEFYEKTIKSNGWSVVTNIKDPDNFEYTLVKGQRDEALIRIKKDPNSGSSVIMLSRTEKPADQVAPTTPQPKTPEKKR